MIDINSASKETLVKELGLNPEAADRIIMMRSAKRFSDLNALAAVPGVSDNDLERISSIVQFDRSQGDEPADKLTTRELIERTYDLVDRFGEVVLSIPRTESGQKDIPIAVSQLKLAVHSLLENVRHELPEKRRVLASTLINRGELDLEIFRAAVIRYVTGGLSGRSDYFALMSAPLDEARWTMIASSADPIRELEATFLLNSGPNLLPIQREGGTSNIFAQEGPVGSGGVVFRQEGNGDEEGGGVQEQSAVKGRLRRLLESMGRNKATIAAILRTLGDALGKDYVRWLAAVLEALNDRNKYAGGEFEGGTVPCYTEIWLTDASTSSGGSVGNDWTLRFNVASQIIDIVFPDDTDINLQDEPKLIKAAWESGLCGQENQVPITFWAVERDGGPDDVGESDTATSRRTCPGIETLVLSSLVSELGEDSTTVTVSVQVIKQCGADDISLGGH